MNKDLLYMRCNECGMGHRPIIPDPRCRCSIIEYKKQPDDDIPDRVLRERWPSNVFLMKVP